MNRYRSFFQAGGLLFAGVIISMVLMEVGLRIFNNQYLRSYEAYVEYDSINGISTYKHIPKEPMGYVYEPYGKGIKANKCLVSKELNFNSLGYRDKEWKTDGRFRIAAIGDSFVTGREVPPDDISTSVIQRLTGFEVMNAGVNGYQPWQYLFTYTDALRTFRPKITLLYFTVGNDILKSNCESGTDRTCGVVEDGKVRVVTKEWKKSTYPKPDSLFWLLGEWAADKSVLVHFVYSFRGKFKNFLSSTSRESIQNLYGKPKTVFWKNSWLIIRDIFERTAREVSQDGGKLVVVIVPTHLMLTPDPKRELLFDFGTKIDSLDLEAPVRRVKEIGEKVGFDVIDPTPFLHDYRKRHNVGYPYFGFWCDGHWNPVSHFLIGNLIARHLFEENYLPVSPQRRRSALRAIERNLTFGPEKILGPEEVRNIYDYGVFRGPSRIREILSEAP